MPAGGSHRRGISRRASASDDEDVELRNVSSLDLDDGRLLEQVQCAAGPKFVVYDPEPEAYPTEPFIDLGAEQIRPIAVDPKLLGALTLPEGVVTYASPEQILADMEGLALEVYDPGRELPLFRFVLRLALASWVIGPLYPNPGRERFAPIIQIIGLPEQGKGRFLTVGRALFYRSLYLNKTVRVPSLFRAIEPFDGTLILDEADLDHSSESAELIEFLNGRSYGNPVLRYSAEADKTRTFQTFGYTLLATRRPYSDPGFNSRAVILRAEAASNPNAIPLVPDSSWYARAMRVRCQLLLLRLRVRALIRARKVVAPSNVEIEGAGARFRIRAAFLPLEAIRELAPKVVEDAAAIAAEISRRQVVERSESVEGLILRTVYETLAPDSLWELRRVGDAWRPERTRVTDDTEETEGREPLTSGYVCESVGDRLGRRRVAQAWRNFGQRVRDRERYGKSTPRGILEISGPARLCREFDQYVPGAERLLDRFGLDAGPGPGLDTQSGGTSGTSGTPEVPAKRRGEFVSDVPVVPPDPRSSVAEPVDAQLQPTPLAIDVAGDSELERAVRILGPTITYPDGTVCDRRTGERVSKVGRSPGAGLELETDA